MTRGRRMDATPREGSKRVQIAQEMNECFGAG
jgi:hypothetical protein